MCVCISFIIEDSVCVSVCWRERENILHEGQSICEALLSEFVHECV